MVVTHTALSKVLADSRLGVNVIKPVLLGEGAMYVATEPPGA